MNESHSYSDSDEQEAGIDWMKIVKMVEITGQHCALLRNSVSRQTVRTKKRTRRL